ncbi:MAG: hypothetical protein B7Y07_12005 [Halothiobacillus sp. 24-54-40]|nr:MAG: hypothetical protein B7Y07_12005 [Halothiobacillus sp. 24-54-40]
MEQNSVAVIIARRDSLKTSGYSRCPNISITGDKTISLQGYSDAQARVADYLRQLNSSGFIEGAVIVGSGILAQEPGKNAPSSNRYVFSITATIKAPKPADAAKEN